MDIREDKDKLDHSIRSNCTNNNSNAELNYSNLEKDKIEEITGYKY